MVMRLTAVAITFIAALMGVEAGHKCVWVHGTVRCHKNPSRNLNVEIRVYDKDGISIAKLIDPDDLMGYAKEFFSPSYTYDSFVLSEVEQAVLKSLPTLQTSRKNCGATLEGRLEGFFHEAALLLFSAFFLNFSFCISDSEYSLSVISS